MSFTLAIGPRVRKSPYFEATLAAGVTHFTTYNHMYMPVSYGDPEGEYWRLIQGVSLWDVAAERQVELAGPDAAALAQAMSPRDLSRCKVGQGKYVPLCDHAGRLINDPVLLKLAEDRFWFSIADSDVLLWARAIAAERRLNVEVGEPDVSPLAIQGPKAEAVVCALFGDWPKSLRYFWFREAELDGIPLVLARSGWSKQGGFELFLRDAARGEALWNRVLEAGRPFDIGPGTPNYVERVESALLSYGADTDADTNPFEVGLDKFVELDCPADYIGKAALRAIARDGPKRRQVGLILDGDPLHANKQAWPVRRDNQSVGRVTAAAFSYRLGRNIAIALIDRAAADDVGELVVETEDGPHGATMTGLPFC